MNNKTILAVNDNADQLELLAFLLAEANYPVLRAENGVEGLEIARRESPALIISDVMMPEMDGIEFCREIRADKELRSTPFLLLTAMRKDTPSVVKGFEAGADDYIEAPYEPMRLAAKVAQLLERRKAAVALCQSEERYRHFIGKSTEGIWRVEFKIPIPIDTPVDEMVELICRHGFYAECNDAMARMYGFESASDITGKNCCELLNFSEREHREFVRAFIENGFRLNEGESHELDANGCDKYFLSNFAGTIEAGNLASVWGIQRDITDKRLAENALRASQEYLEVAQKTAMIGSFEFDFRTRLLTCSASMESLYGAAQGSLCGNLENWIKYIHPEDSPRIEEELKQSTAQPEYRSEFRILLADGNIRWIVSKGKTFCEEGKATRLIGVNIDITERKQNELTLRFQKSLLEAQSKASLDGILVVALSGEVLSYNQRFAEMWEISEDALAAKSDEKLLQAVIDKLVDPQGFLEHIEYLYQNPFIKEMMEIVLKDNRIFERYSAPVGGSDTALLGRIWYFRDIGKRKQIEEALRESEKHYRLLFDSNPLPMWVYDIESLDFLAVNDAAIFHYGYSREEFLSMTIKDIRPKEDIPALLKQVSQIQGGIEAASFWRHVKKTGDVIDVEITSHVLMFAGKRAELVLAVDVTERKKAEDSIRFQAHLLNTVEQAVIATNLEGTVIYWNQFAEKLYGWTDVEAINRNIKELTTPEINAAQADQIMSQLRTGKSWTGEFTVRNKAGAFFPAHVSNSPVTDNNGELMGIVGISVDISERKKAEEQIRKADIRALIEYEKLLERIGSLAEALGTARELLTIYMALRSFALETTPCSGIFVSLFDPERQVRLPSYAFSEGEEIDLSGLPPMPMNDSPHSRAVATGQAIITDDFQAETKGLPVVNVGLERNPALPQSSLVTPMSIMGRVIGAVEIQSIRKAAFGKEHITAMRMAANLIANAIENVRLIDQEREKEEQLRLSQKLESVGRMAGGIAHDFNNMLTAINGYSELTLRRLEPANPLRGNIEEIKKAGERSAALTQQLLAFSRRQVLKPKIISFNEVVLDISKMLRHLIGEDMHLSIVPFSELGLVEADPGQLTQVIMNLAINARDAMPSGGNLTIETSNVYLDEEYAKNHAPTQPGSYVLLSVSDCGTGMSEHVKQHIFEPFYTTKETGRGTGLGLATVYGIIKQSGGYIWVDSEEDVGTTFKIYLPRVDTESALAPEEKAAAMIERGTETILLVEDEDIVRKMSRQMLKVCGYTIIEARNGVEALSLCESENLKIDLLLTDVVMPQMGGRELAARLAEKYPHLRLLYTSGYTDDAIIRRGIVTEDMNFMQKPFTFEALTKKIRELLDQK